MKSLLLVVVAALVGCSSQSTVLVNAKGEERYCESSGYGLIGMQISTSRYANCVNEAGKDGFKPKDVK